MNNQESFPAQDPSQNQTLIELETLQHHRNHTIKRGFFEAGMVAAGSVVSYNSIKNGNGIEAFLATSLTLVYGRLLVNNCILGIHTQRQITDHTP